MDESTSEHLQTILRIRQQQTLQAKGMPSVSPLPPDYADAVEAIHQLLTDVDSDHVLTAQAFDSLAARNRDLSNKPEVIAAAFASQTQILERLFLRYVQRAEACTKPEHRHLAMRTALACQRQAVTTLSVIYQVQRDQARVPA